MRISLDRRRRSRGQSLVEFSLIFPLAMLLFMGLATSFYGYYILRRAGKARRTYAEDDPEADHAKQAGERVGWFSSGSVWPLVMGIGLGVGLEGFVYGAWLLFFGGLLFIWATIGLMMESRG